MTDRPHSLQLCVGGPERIVHLVAASAHVAHEEALVLVAQARQELAFAPHHDRLRAMVDEVEAALGVAQVLRDTSREYSSDGSPTAPSDPSRPARAERPLEASRATSALPRGGRLLDHVGAVAATGEGDAYRAPTAPTDGSGLPRGYASEGAAGHAPAGAPGPLGSRLPASRTEGQHPARVASTTREGATRGACSLGRNVGEGVFRGSTSDREGPHASGLRLRRASHCGSLRTCEGENG